MLITQTTRGHKAIECSLKCTNVYKQYTAWDPIADGLSQGVRYRRDSSTRCVARCADVLITFCRVWLLLLIKLTKATWNFTQKTHTNKARCTQTNQKRTRRRRNRRLAWRSKLDWGAKCVVRSTMCAVRRSRED